MHLQIFTLNIFPQDKDEEGKPMGLGLSIVGGSDTLLGAIFIHEVYEAGWCIGFDFV